MAADAKPAAPAQRGAESDTAVRFRPRRSSRASSFILMLCTSASRLLGFVRIAVIGAVFGATGSADVLNAVFMIPNNLRKLLAEGALSSAFIPELAREIAAPGGRPRELVGRLLTLLVGIVLPLVALCVLFAGPVVRLMLDFPEPWKMTLAIDLFRLVFPYLLLVSVSAVLMATLNCHEVFAVPALAPLLFSVHVIAAILLFHDRLGLFAAGVGILVGGAAGLVGQLPVFLRRGYRLKPDFSWRDPRLARIARQWVPVVTSSSVFAIAQQVAIAFASGLQDGSSSALANALVFWQLPFGVLSVSVVTAHFPRMSHHAAAADRPALAATFAGGMKLIVALLLPPALFYLFLGEQSIQVALERGTFSAVGTRLAGRVLFGYSLGLVSVGLFTFAQRYFFSVRDYRTPLLVAIVVAAVDIPLSLVLKETRLAVAGLAVANSVAFTVGAIILLIKSRRQLADLKSEGIGAHILRVTVANVPLAMLLWAAASTLPRVWQPASTLRNALALGLVGAVAVTVILLMYKILHVPLFRQRSRTGRPAAGAAPAGAGNTATGGPHEQDGP